MCLLVVAYFFVCVCVSMLLLSKSGHIYCFVHCMGSVNVYVCMWQCASAGVAVCGSVAVCESVVVAVVAMHVRTHEYQKPILL